LQLTQTVLHHDEVGLPRVIHVEADLLDGVGDVEVDEHQVLEDTNEVPKLSRINNRRPGLSGDIGLRIHGCRNWLVIHHVDAFKDVKSILVLREEEPI
jgi:hypothetical protein